MFYLFPKENKHIFLVSEGVYPKEFIIVNEKDIWKYKLK